MFLTRTFDFLATWTLERPLLDVKKTARMECCYEHGVQQITKNPREIVATYAQHLGISQDRKLISI